MQARLLFALALLARATGFGPAVPQRTLEGANFLGYNVVNLQSGNFSGDAAYVASTAGLLHAGVLRYPGGNLADWWDWKTGWCVAQPKVGCCPQLKNPCTKMVERGIIRVYRHEEFMLALDASGANAVLMMNMLTLTLADQMAYLEHAKSIGALRHGTYIELGGEFYWGKYGGRSVLHI